MRTSCCGFTTMPRTLAEEDPDTQRRGGVARVGGPLQGERDRAREPEPDVPAAVRGGGASEDLRPGQEPEAAARRGSAGEVDDVTADLAVRERQVDGRAAGSRGRGRRRR